MSAAARENHVMGVPTISRASDPRWHNHLVESLMRLPDADGVSASTLAHAWRSARLRVQLLREMRPETAATIAARGRVTEAELDRWSSTGALFTLERDEEILYPTFQFTHGDRPDPGIAKILTALKPSTSWDVGIWFISRSESLDDNRPIDIFPGELNRIVEAALHDGSMLVRA